MATWAVQQAGNFATPSDNAASPWYDGGAQTALASIPQVGDTITNAGAFNLTFNIDLPAVTSVLDSDTVYGAAGTYHAPDAAEVVDTAVFGPSSSISGTYHAPEASEVIDTAVFGPSSSISGTYHAPEASEVIDTAVFGPSSSISGTYHAPEASEVIDTAVFGPSSSISGTFDEEARNTDPGEAAVQWGVQYTIHNVAKTGKNMLSGVVVERNMVSLQGTVERNIVVGKHA
jgi:hypothetical protein